MRLALLSLLLAPGLAAAQTALAPGSPELAAPPPQSFSFDVRTQGRSIGQMTQAERLDGDRLVMASSVVVPMGSIQTVDTTTVAWPGLAPVARVTYGDQERATLSYAGGRVAGRSVLGNLDEALDAPLPAGAFSEGAGPRLARSLPFADGYTATFQTADRRGDVSTGRLAVSGPAERDGRTVWQVELVEPGAYPMTYDIDGATREILGVTIRPSPSMVVTAGPASN